jgi:hypothetical protein
MMGGIIMYDTELIVNVRWEDIEYSFIKYDLLFECYEFDRILIDGILFYVDNVLFEFDNKSVVIFFKDMVFQYQDGLETFCEELEGKDWVLMEE